MIKYYQRICFNTNNKTYESYGGALVKGGGWLSWLRLLFSASSSSSESSIQITSTSSSLFVFSEFSVGMRSSCGILGGGPELLRKDLSSCLMRGGVLMFIGEGGESDVEKIIIIYVTLWCSRPKISTLKKSL